MTRRSPIASASAAARSHLRVEGLTAVGGGLVDDRVAAVTVEADRRLVDQRRRLALEPGERPDQVPGAGAAALHDPLLRLVGPALVDLLALEVDDDLDPVEGVGRRPFQGRLPALPEDGRVGRHRPFRVTGEADDGVASIQQRVAQGRADEAARAGDQDLHAF
jgi:hypothetical protein